MTSAGIGTTTDPVRVRELLVVDDDEDIVETLAALLEHEGYRIRRATSGGEALRLLENDPVQMVITDYAMPGMDGPELLRIMCEKFDMKDVPVVVVSATEEEVVREKCPTMAAFLLKPFKPDALVRVVRRLLEP
jgi:two-component system response regulator FlrC